MYIKIYEKAIKMKKAFCFNICPCHSLWKNVSKSDLRISSVTSVEKRESWKHFSASACGLGFKKLFLGSLSSTSVTLEKLKSDEDKFFLRRVMDKYRNKILFQNQNQIDYQDTFFGIKSIKIEGLITLLVLLKSNLHSRQS